VGKLTLTESLKRAHDDLVNLTPHKISPSTGL